MRSKVFILLFLCLLGLPIFAQRPQYGKMSPLLRQLTRRFSSIRHLPSSSNHRPSAVCAFVKTSDPQVFEEHRCRILASAGQVYIVSIPVNEIGALSLDSRIMRMEARRGTSLTNDQMATHLNALRAYEGLNLPQAFTGRGVVVGVMDVGFDLTHPTFYSADTTQYRIRRFWDMVTQDTVGSSLFVGRDYVGRENLLALGHSRDGMDLSHGTHTTGTAAGSGYRSLYRGMAPEADICLVANAVMDDLVYIDSADVYKYTLATDALGFKYLFDYAKSVGKPCVASFSEGSMQDFWGNDQLYCEMLDSLTGPGCIIVSSAGNNGYLKSWFHKAAGQLSAGSFLQSASDEATLTLKSADDFLLRFVLYGHQNDTLMVSTKEVLLEPDSVGKSSLLLDDYQLLVQTEAYPSCYDAEEMCYDVTIQVPDRVGMNRPLSIEVMGREADVECYRVNVSLTTNALNPLLDAGDESHSILSPSSAPCVISVGATSYRDSIQNLNGEWKSYWLGNGGVRVPFSSMGPTFDGRMKPDVMAPGNNIISSYSSFYLENHPNNNDIKWDVAHFDFNGRTYAWNSDSGTSMSCPAVAGAIALWLQAKPDLTPQEVLEVISRTSHHYDESLSWPNNEYGYGEIDVYRGLLYILGIDRIEEVSRQHTSARITYDAGWMHVVFEEPLSSSVRLRLYTINGRLVQTAAIREGQSSCSFSLNHLPAGIYAIQLDGNPVVKGSTLIRL